MNNALKFAAGFVAVALVIGLSGVPAMANSRFGIMGINSGMMGSGLGMGGMHRGMMQSMMSGFGFRNMMDIANSTNGTFDMNIMHRLMHGEASDVDMNAMHQRMLAGNLTQEDLNEMGEHCPMM